MHVLFCAIVHVRFERPSSYIHPCVFVLVTNNMIISAQEPRTQKYTVDIKNFVTNTHSL